MQPSQPSTRAQPPQTHVGGRLPDVVQLAGHRRLQALVGVAAGGQLNQALSVLLDEVAALAVAAGVGGAGEWGWVGWDESGWVGGLGLGQVRG